MTTQAIGGDVPEHCPKCKQTTLFRPDREGTYHCLRCLAGAASPSTPASPSTVVIKKPADGVMMTTIKFAGFLVALIVILGAVTCVAGLGMCGQAINDSSHKKP
jgi:hypothetical protein